MDASRNPPEQGWLSLARRENESLRLTTGAGEVIWIRVHNVRDGQCSVSIAAPPSVSIKRREILD